MVISNLLESLNNEQREAVTAPLGKLLVLAGAGSGKTKVIVHRIAWLLTVKNCLSCSMIAVTFSNKAAAEMRYRIEHLIGSSKDGMWIGTFHGLSYRLLQSHYQDANLSQNFQILDTDGQLRLLKSLIRTMNLDEKKYHYRQILCFINDKKDKGLFPQDLKIYGSNPIDSVKQHIYQEYQETCNRSGLVDFSELLLRSYKLFLNKPHILQYYRERFANILVDEFQDTNKIQYNWIRMLTGDNGNIMIVGDDDQSIYGWRGAQIKNIQRFLNDFPNAKTIFLEQNYRSTSNILRSANTLISHNTNRLGKNLWTKGIKGELITLYCAFNELDEAQFVVNCVKLLLDQGWALKDCAILYRSNIQSRVLEEFLLRTGLSYRIYGGISFFERQEIKDALAYLRLIVNRNDDSAYERIFNKPVRGLGDRTLFLLRKTAYSKQLTLWQASLFLIMEKSLDKRAITSLERFVELIDFITKETTKLPLHIQINKVIKYSGLLNMYKQEDSERGLVRVKNLKELVISARQFGYNNQDQNFISPLHSFLSHITLENSNDKINNIRRDEIQLMTLHSAKGLEFPQVFIIGMEEGLFPNQKSLMEEGCLEEERRLAYVGVTRAMHKLTISHAKTRRLYGKKVYHCPSRFITELPVECIMTIC